MPEIGAATDRLERFLSATPLGVDLIRARLLRDDNQDVRKLVLRISGVLDLQRREVVFDFGIAHGKPALDLALAQPLHNQLVADVFAVLRVRNIFLRERLAKVLGGEFVVLRDTLNRPFDECVVDLDARLFGKLQQRSLSDEALEHLLLEHINRRRLQLLLLHLLQHDARCVVDIVLSNRLVVYHCDHAVDTDHSRRRPSGSEPLRPAGAGRNSPHQEKKHAYCHVEPLQNLGKKSAAPGVSPPGRAVGSLAVV